MYELLCLHVIVLHFAQHGAKRVHDNDARAGCLDSLGDLFQYSLQSTIRQHFAEVDEADGVVDFGYVKENVLLLVAQHFQGRFTENSKVERRSLRSGIGEDELVRQRGLAASRGPRDNVEREFRQTAAQDIVQAWNPSRQFFYRDFIFWGHVSL